MKTAFAAMIMVSVCSSGFAAEGTTSAGLLRKGQAAEQDGDLAGARTAYTEALKADPGNANARYYLSGLEQRSAAIAGRAREKRLAGITIGQIEFDRVSLQEALEALGAMIEKASGDKYAANLVIRDPDKKFEGLPVTLKVNGMPAKAALELIIRQAGGRAVFQEHLVLVTPATK